jgi:hypothetical protein
VLDVAGDLGVHASARVPRDEPANAKPAARRRKVLRCTRSPYPLGASERPSLAPGPPAPAHVRLASPSPVPEETADERRAPPAPTPAPDAPTRARPDHRERRVDIASALLLSIATVLAAWSAIQSAKWAANRRPPTPRQAAAGRSRSGHRRTPGRTPSSMSRSSCSSSSLSIRGQEACGLLSRTGTRGVPPGAGCVDRPGSIKNSATAPPTPFQMPQYSLQETVTSERYQQQADGKFQQALQDNQRSDNYVLLAVLFASVLLSPGWRRNRGAIRSRWR